MSMYVEDGKDNIKYLYKLHNTKASIIRSNEIRTGFYFLAILEGKEFNCVRIRVGKKKVFMYESV